LETPAVKFQSLYWLAAIVLVLPLCIFLLRWGARRTRESLDRIIAPRLHEQLLRSVDFAKRRFKWALFIVALACLLAALARPLYGNREIKVERAGVDLIIALDVSKSMLAEDAGTNRLTAAKETILKLLDRPNGDRIGLIAFAGEAYLMAPVTLDHNAVRRSLSALNTTAISKPGSDIAAAIKLAARSFDEKQRDGKALVIMSDGEELQGEAVIAAREISTKGISIFTVGVGSTTGRKVPDRGTKPTDKIKFAKNEFGNEVVSKMNERVLQQIAVAGHGFYAQLGPEGEGLFTVDERGLRPLAKGTQTRLSKEMREYFQWPLGLAAALLFWELLVNERKKRV
jgi:Ca-activated chloride channel family protein